MPLLLPYGGHEPVIAPSAWIAPNATLIGAVTIGEGASVWFGAVIRADGAPIHIGAGSNVQDGCVFHTDAGHPLSLGTDVAVGHNVVLHGCAIGNGVLIGMSSTVLNGAEVGTGSLVAAGAVVLENTLIPSRSLVAGVPAKIRRATSEAETEMIAENSRNYRVRAATYGCG